MDYDKLVMREYSLWTLQLHHRQYPYIGRSIAVARRENARHALDMNALEAEQLFEEVIPDWHRAVHAAFQFDWPNVLCHANTWRHLHWHLVPRYFSPRQFAGIEFVDPKPDRNYAPYPKHTLDEEVTFAVRDLLMSNL